LLFILTYTYIVSGFAALFPSPQAMRISRVREKKFREKLRGYGLDRAGA
jgi:hypothetical protein